ncbi:Nif11-like leader peptide family RiPP precursor [Achromobacter sp. GG226]|uniref:Nif11-like leader peptide family RiPP precursor n=1 Tax=Verticiella alkaliphila TaxID=2779529 RepID=UPI001C0CCDF1|nr:Nif11-like leader peptide family RiPP precursor [Verticiella sp. GG226]MBU4609581.1 Nif11-like leader peptide family RiPP precursor [Verticiella sp. GG226]
MSKSQSYQEFYQKVTADPAAVDRLKQAPEGEPFFAEAAKIAQEKGYSLSADDIRAAVQGEVSAGAELKDEELEAVSGGAAYYTDTAQDTKCMKLYGWCPGQ